MAKRFIRANNKLNESIPVMFCPKCAAHDDDIDYLGQDKIKCNKCGYEGDCREMWIDGSFTVSDAVKRITGKSTNEKLIQSPSKDAFSKNVSTEIKAGKPQKQAVAIAYDIQRKNMKKKVKESADTIKRYSDVVPKEKRKYWYFTTHGVGPGSIPKGINVLDTKDGKNRKGTDGTFVLLDAVLNTDELKKYDMIELAPKDIKEGLQDTESDFYYARKRFAKEVPDAVTDFDDMLDMWNEESELAEPDTWYAKPIYSEKAWRDFILFAKSKGFVPMIKDRVNEDTVKQGSAWVNKGKEGTHGKFKTKKEADA